MISTPSPLSRLWRHCKSKAFNSLRYGMGSIKAVHLVRTGIASAMVLTPFLLCAAKTVSAQNLTTYNVPGAVLTAAHDISGTSIVGYYTDNVAPTGGYRGFLYNGASYTDIAVPGALDTFAYGISGNNIVGTYENNGPASPAHGFLYNGVSYTTIDFPGARSTYAHGISGNNIVGVYDNTNHPEQGFLYNGTSYINIAVPGALATVPQDISENNIVGNYGDSNDDYIHGFLYNGTTYITIDYPGAHYTWANGISANNIVGTYQDSSNGHEHGFLYNGTRYITVDVPGAHDTEIWGISGNAIVGAYGDSNDVWHGFQLPGPMVPTASFTANPTSGAAPLVVQLTDTSMGSPTRWSWNFGDRAKSTKQNPSHIFKKAGVYTVNLTASNKTGSSSTSGIIEVTSLKPTASFTANPTSGMAPLNVQFSDTSSGSPTRWSWNFGDRAKSTKQNPSHIFKKAGVYTVKLAVGNATGSSSASNNITVTK